VTIGLYLEPPLQVAIIAGRRQAWRQAGEGERLPLFLLHGIGSNARAWAGQFAGFSGERRVIAWNAPGYADSEPLSTDWPAPSDYAAAALALLDHLHISRCILVGQSLGAVMAAELARGAPERIAALVLASPAGGYGSAPRAALPEKVAQRVADLEELGPGAFAARRAASLLTGAASPAAYAIVRLAMSEVTPEGYVQAARLLASADLARDVAGLSLSIAVVWGDADVITPPESCRRIAAAARCVGIELAGLGHAFATEAPERFNDSIRPLMAAAEPRSEAWT
jgi:pimeloyl-ACP methyl ester carboxylesterase